MADRNVRPPLHSLLIRQLFIKGGRTFLSAIDIFSDTQPDPETAAIRFQMTYRSFYQRLLRKKIAKTTLFR
jgi:hypothetical protein